MKQHSHLTFSVLMSVYFNETPENFILSFDSVVNQTVLPNEIILIKDGPLPSALNTIINNYKADFPKILKVIDLPHNVGLGKALDIGLNVCNNNLIARMDTDDICFPERFEKQLAYINIHSDVSVVGCQIEEFNLMPGDLKRYRKLPSSSPEIDSFSKYRNPVNHPTVLFRKDHVLAAGSYQHMPLFEDYYLWSRMLKLGFKINNIEEPLLYFRIGNDMVGRRNGYTYVLKELEFLIAIKNIGFINTMQFIVSLCCKLPIRMLPKRFLEFVYKSVLR